MLFRNAVRVRNGIRKNAGEILVTGKRTGYHLKQIYRLPDDTGLSMPDLKKMICLVTNPMVKTKIPVKTIYSLNILSAIYGIKEFYVAELLEHYQMTEDRPGRLLFHRK